MRTHVGFTGTKNEPTDLQLFHLEAVLSLLFNEQDFSTFHHGDCVGADAAASYFARTIGYYVVAHPPEIKTFQASSQAHEVMPRKPYLDRNRDIVKASRVLISVPKKEVTFDQILRCENGTRRGGTFYTTRYAMANNKDIFMILPNGAIKYYGETFS